nr:MAG TPA: hypothetical protein [Caudoviricetes sp.]
MRIKNKDRKSNSCVYARIGVNGIRQPQSAKEVSGFARKYSRKTFKGRGKKA